MQFNGALIKEQGVEFAIIVVKPQILKQSIKRDEILNSCAVIFPDIPIILMAQDSRGIPKYFGRKDIVKCLANIDITRIPFKRYTTS
ncbi:hypothetical protein HPDP_00301 [Candidatus Hepatincola sp. Pdp]